MNKFLILALCLTLGSALRLPAQCPQLIWSDEFSGSQLNLSNWEPLIGDGCDIGLCGWGNNELQYYKAENATVSNGTLKITAKQERVRGKKYTSARLRTKNLQDFTYGRMEARIKLPYGQGIWPAFWMLSTNEPYGYWPQSGEIDIMELVGNESDKVHGTIHYGEPSPNNQSQGGSYRLHSGIFNDAFHEFAIEWAPGEIRWYVDGYHYLTKNSADVAPFNWPFDHDFHFLLNLAVGGNWPGSPDNTTVFPQVMEVDYVRVYDTSRPAISGKRTVANQAAGEVYSVANAPAGSSYSWSVPAGAAIVSGQGTSSVTVNWGTSGGDVVVNLSSACGAQQLVLNVAMEAAYAYDFSFERFDDPGQLTFVNTTGSYTPDAPNPAPQGVNTSALVGHYVRNAAQQYDVLIFSTGAIADGAAYVGGQRKFYIDVYSNAPPGTLILLQLENSGTATGSNYPTGRHSRYEAYTTVQNQWERLAFTYLDRPDGSVPNNAINQLIFLFASNSFTGYAFDWDNFDSYAVGGGGTNDPPSVSLTAPANGSTFQMPATITVSANAADADGSVTQVEFFANGASIGVDNSSPYGVNWTVGAAGAYALTARATDNEGAATTSAPVNITVNNPPGGSYCASQSLSEKNEWISAVTIGGFSHSSGASTYSDFTGTTASLAAGAHAATLTPTYKGPARAEYWRIWMDLNNDLDFNDAGELVFAGNGTGTITGTLTVPAGAAGVTTRMRIAMKRDAAPTPCETFDKGEVEDYTVQIGGGAARILEDQNGNVSGVQMYPNPVRERLFLNMSEEMRPTKIRILDANGRVLRLIDRKDAYGSQSVDVHDLAAGFYFLRIETSSGQEMNLRFVKE